MNFPKVSIIMSVYNGEKFIAETIESILRQDYKNFELIIIDDASTDNTVEIVNLFRDERIILIKNEINMRLAHNLNTAIKLSSGKYIARIDADDIFLKKRLVEQVRYMESNPDVLVLGGYAKQFGNENNILKYPLSYELIKVSLLFENSICHPAIIFRNDPKKIYYNPEFIASQDYELWSRLIWDNKIENIPKKVIKYRIHGNQTKHLLKQEQNSGARYARIIMLKKVLDNLSEEEEELFISACNIHSGKTKNELEAISNLFNCIAKENRSKKIYNPQLLDKVMDKVYLKNYYVSLKKEYIHIKVLLNSINYVVFLNNPLLSIKILLLILRQYTKKRGIKK